MRGISEGMRSIADGVARTKRSHWLLLLAAALCAAHTAAADERALGRIEFPTSGSGEAEEQFVRGVLALHSFWYPEALDRFRAAQALDPSFGMAHWGEAMIYDDPLGAASHVENGETLGADVVARMDRLDADGRLLWSERERRYADAVRQRFRQDLPLPQRRRNYFEAMRDLAERYPEDDEATAFAALALMALPGFDIEQPAHVVAVASRLEELYERNPEHPGVLHYLIHVYDTETFARMGLRQARRYAEIAAASSHALHMPSHIFRHLGMWEEVASSNRAAYEASVEWQQRTGRPLQTRDWHALDWLLGSYVNLGRYGDARSVIDELAEVEAEIMRRGEQFNEFAAAAEHMRAYYERQLQRHDGVDSK